MRLFEIIKDDHVRLRRRLDELRASSASSASSAEKTRLFEALQLAVEDHLRAEEGDLNDLLEISGGEVLAEDARDEGDQIEQLLNELDECSPASPRFDDRLQDLERALGAHVERVERGVFGAAVELLTEPRLEELAGGTRPLPDESWHEPALH